MRIGAKLLKPKEQNAKIKILIVDDEKAAADMLTKRLQAKLLNAEMFVSTDPLQILDLVETHDPDLLLLDFKMPSRSGLECLKDIRSKYSKIDLPIIMLTAEDSSESIVTCLESGANDYIVKGSPFSVVLCRIESLINVGGLLTERVRTSELAAIMAMVVSYNHEINNPLSIALLYLDQIKNGIDSSKFQKISNSLLRIAEVVKNIDGVGKKFQIEYEEYKGATKMIKLKD